MKVRLIGYDQDNKIRDIMELVPGPKTLKVRKAKKLMQQNKNAQTTFIKRVNIK